MSVPGAARDRVVAWALDPRHVLVTWDVTPATRVRALRRLGARARDARPALRLLSDLAEPPVDLPPDAVTHVFAATRVGPWVVELGFRLADGGFAPLARSSPVGGPPVSLPSDSRVTWVSADRPTVPVVHAWSGRCVAIANAEPTGPGASDASLR